MEYINKDEFITYWNKGTFVFDSCIFIFLNQCNHTYAKDIMDILMFKEEQIWVPYQVKKEVTNHKNKGGQVARLKTHTKKLQDTVERVKTNFETYVPETKDEGYEVLSDVLSGANIDTFFFQILQRYNDTAKELSEENRSFLTSAMLKLFYDSLFKYVKASFNEVEIQQIENKGEERYKNSIPPGFKDEAKIDNKYGDLIIWKEILKYSKAQKSPMLFITNDLKADWMEYTDNMLIGANPKLLEEYRKEVNHNSPFNIISLSEFLKCATDYVGKDISKLLERIKKDEIYSFIEDYLCTECTLELNEVITDWISSQVQADYGEVDEINDIEVKFKDEDGDEENGEIIIRALLTIHATVDHNYHSNGEDFEFNGNEAVFIVEAEVSVDIKAGEYNSKNKSLTLDDIRVDFSDIDVIRFDDPIAGDESERDELEWDEQDYDELGWDEQDYDELDYKEQD